MLPEETSKLGLTSAEAKKRLSKYGPNSLPEKPPPSNWKILLDQVKNPLVYILVAAGIVTFFLGHIPDTVIIFIAVITNGALGYFQEKKAGKALNELKKLVHPQANVIRDGEAAKIDASKIVPGDVVILQQGDKVPADGVIIKDNRLFIDEAIITGESVAVKKVESGEVFMGTVVSSGRGVLMVKVTGEGTQIGGIAMSIQDNNEQTPLKKQLNKFSKKLVYLVVGLVVFIFIVGIVKDKSVPEIFSISVALAVSAIPEGILVGLTVVLAIGMQRILKKKGLVRNLASAETLGGVSVICVDKTGTLTKGKMKVVDAVGDIDNLALQALVANDLDDPVMITAAKWARLHTNSSGQAKKVDNDLERKHERIDSIPFSPVDRFFVSLNKWDSKGNMVFVNGAPEYLAEWSNLDESARDELLRTVDGLTSEGKRVVGFARKRVAKSKTVLKESDAKKDLEWVGLLVFTDPVRVGVKLALEKTRDAGVKLIVITGDYPKTAISVMNQLGVDTCTDCVVTGNNLSKMSPTELRKSLVGKHPVKLFARTTPDQKLKIVEALKKNGEIVAMMGDGVNDAPALSMADIGIVVESASDVAKETADLVLMDSKFSTVVSAIEEGRGMYDNIRKIVLYLMSDSFEEIVAVVGAIIIGLPLPVTAAQILWINLVSDGFPDIALTVDPKDKGIMKRMPRRGDEGIVAGWMRSVIIIVSLSGGIIALALFAYYYKTSGDVNLARSIAFAALGVNSLVYVYSIRTLRKPFWKENPFKNKWLNLSVIAGLILQILPFVLPGLRKLFGVVSLSLAQWLTVFIASLVMFIIIEGSKVLMHKEKE